MKNLGYVNNYNILGQASKSGLTKWLKVLNDGIDKTSEFAEKNFLKVNKAGFIQFCGTYNLIMDLLNRNAYSAPLRQIQFNQ